MNVRGRREAGMRVTRAGDMASPSELAPDDVGLDRVDCGVGDGGGVGDVVMPGVPSGGFDDCASVAVVEDANFVEGPCSETRVENTCT